MLEILLSWVFTLIVSFGWGYIFPGVKHLKSLPLVSKIFAQMLLGILVLAVFLSIAHFFLPMAHLALLFVVSLVGIVLIALKRDVNFSGDFRSLDAAFLVFVLAIWIRTAGPIGSMDSGIYHLPYIKWLESYPIVDGLANVHSRFGFNYHYHLLAAFFGLESIAGSTVHALNGLIYLGIAIVIYGIIRSISKGIFRIFFGVVFLVLSLIVNGMNSFSPDFPVAAYEMLALSLVVFYRSKKKAMPYNFLIVIALALVPLKLSSFTLVFVILILTRFRIFFTRKIWAIGLIGLIIFIPFFLRNYHLTGYLIYPLASLDFFDPLWKLPHDIVDFERNVVRNYALGLDLFYTGEVHWNWDLMLQWLDTARGYNKAGYWGLLLFGFDILVLLLLIVRRLVKKKKLDKIFVGMFLGILLALLIWMKLGPAPRFVYGYLAVLTGLTAMAIVDELNIGGSHIVRMTNFSMIVAALLAMLGVWGVSLSGGLNYPDSRTVSIIHQWNYPTPSIQEKKQQGRTIYKTKWDIGCWESPLPCSYERDDFIMIDSMDLSVGFLPSLTPWVPGSD